MSGACAQDNKANIDELLDEAINCEQIALDCKNAGDTTTAERFFRERDAVFAEALHAEQFGQ